MRHWLSDYQAVSTTASRRDEWIAELDRLRQRKATFEKRLQAASGRTDSDVAVLLAAAHQAVDQAKDHRRRTVDLHQSLERLKPRLAGCDREASILERRQAPGVPGGNRCSRG